MGADRTRSQIVMVPSNQMITAGVRWSLWAWSGGHLITDQVA